ncbi:MAG: HDIG domain-containing protein [Desulfarculaceae bacterium]|nr:HDIG domain-containing protein [Desulfarculaceae bacterium]MCF8124359.1 HDIG domain-containing protein [Desulfarculaceae bacterium]
MVELVPRFSADTPLPSVEQIQELWDEYAMLDNIREHSRVVCGVALRLADWLGESGFTLNRRAVQAGALLHDIAKTMCLGQKCRHDLEGGRIMEDLGYRPLAYLVANHVLLPPDQPLDETMLVNYADKRVTHDQLVTLPERFAYITQRYGRGDPAIEQRIALGLERASQAEEQIFAHIDHGRTPADVTPETVERP